MVNSARLCYHIPHSLAYSNDSLMLQFAVIGGGSIGMRHARNLAKLGQGLRIIENQPAQAERIQGEGFAVYADLSAAFAPEVDAVLICTPSAYHLEQTCAALEANKHVFVEKPIATNLEGVPEVLDLAAQKSLVTLVGFNMRFRDGYNRAKAALEALGKPYIARALVSFYLPYYHPERDYRMGYQARRELGGGVVLDDLHEIDYLMDLFGPIKTVYANVGRLSDLEMDVEDYAAAQFEHESGIISQLQMDFLGRVYRRTLEVTAEKGTLTLDHNAGELRIYGAQPDQYKVYPQAMSVTVNDMYFQEMQHFIACIQGHEKPIADLQTGYEVLRVAKAIFQSAAEQKVISL